MRLIIIIILTLIIFYIYINNIYSINNNNSYVNNNVHANNEEFIVTTEQHILNDKCPDYLTFDGYKYYLIYNKYPGNPEIFDSLIKAHNRLEQLGCPKFKPITLVHDKDNKDPTVGYERICNKEVALNKFIVDAYNFSLNDEQKSDVNLNKDLDINYSISKIPEYLKEYNNSLSDFLKDTKIDKESNKDEVRKILNNYIVNATPEDLVNYVGEICMINKYSSDPLNFNSGSFYDNYNSINVIDSKVGTDEETDNSGNDDAGTILRNEDIYYPLMDEVWYLNTPITNIMTDKIFSV